VVLDIQTPEGLASAKLIGQSDVLLENFRPGLMDKLGLDAEALRAAFPRLIYVSQGLSARPLRDRLALDEVVQNMAGLTYMTGPKGGRCAPAARSTTSWAACSAPSACWLRCANASAPGRARRSERLFENCCLLASQHMQQFQMTGEVPPPFPHACRPGAFTTPSTWRRASSCSSAP
jgi:formyl-CoA transferase